MHECSTTWRSCVDALFPLVNPHFLYSFGGGEEGRGESTRTCLFSYPILRRSGIEARALGFEYRRLPSFVMRYPRGGGGIETNLLPAHVSPKSLNRFTRLKRFFQV